LTAARLRTPIDTRLIGSSAVIVFIFPPNAASLTQRFIID
jgi:hypothetical protein